MGDFRMKTDFLTRNLLYKVLIFIATVAVIVYFMPRDGKFSYQFDIGKPWKYGQLMATFDFPIYKGNEEMQKEQDSVMQRYTPYFQLNKEAGDRMIAKFRQDYETSLKGIIPYSAYRQHIEHTLAAIYAEGIVAPNDLVQLEKDSVARIQVFDKNTSKQKDVAEVYTVKRAYEQLVDADTARYRKYLETAAEYSDSAGK